jgi:histone H1/5
MATKKITNKAEVAKAPAVKAAATPVKTPAKKAAPKAIAPRAAVNKLPMKEAAVAKPAVKKAAAKKPVAKKSLAQKKTDANTAFKDLVAKPATTAAAAAAAMPEANTPAKIAEALGKRGDAGVNVKRRKVAKDAFAKKVIAEASTSCKDVGRTLREVRLKAGLTQSQLAAKTTLARTSISNIEAGRQTLTIERLYELVDALGFTLTLELVPSASK